MPWKCPECGYLNPDDNIEICMCGERLDSYNIENTLSGEIKLTDEHKNDGFSSAIKSLLIPIFFIFSLFVWALTSIPVLFYISPIACLYGVFLSALTINNRKKSIKIISMIGGTLNIVCILIFSSNCSFSNSYGPYIGKIIDKETGQPLMGAVVAMRVYEETSHAAGHSSSFVTSTEVITNEHGEFIVPLHKAQKDNPLSRWSDEYVLFYKPGYASYSCSGEELAVTTDKINPETSPVTIKLQKLNTQQKNEITDPDFGGFTSTLYVLSHYDDQQNVEKGYRPYQIANYWRYKGIIQHGEKTIFDYPIERRIYRRQPQRISTSRVITLNGKHLKPNERPRGNLRMASDFPVKQPVKQPEDVGTVKYKNNNEQEELINQLKKINVIFTIEDDFTVKFASKYLQQVDKEVEKIDKKPRIFFINQDYKDYFVTSLEKNNIPYLTRTIPNAIGFDIIWHYEHNTEVEKIKLELFNRILQRQNRKIT